MYLIPDLSLSEIKRYCTNNQCSSCPINTICDLCGWDEPAKWNIEKRGSARIQLPMYIIPKETLDCSVVLYLDKDGTVQAEVFDSLEEGRVCYEELKGKLRKKEQLDLFDNLIYRLCRDNGLAPHECEEARNLWDKIKKDNLNYDKEGMDGEKQF